MISILEGHLRVSMTAPPRRCAAASTSKRITSRGWSNPNVRPEHKRGRKLYPIKPAAPVTQTRIGGRRGSTTTQGEDSILLFKRRKRKRKRKRHLDMKRE
jgi:hypothetical protein